MSTGDEAPGESAGEEDPVEAIFRIIDRYYKGLTREDEGMGAD